MPGSDPSSIDHCDLDEAATRQFLAAHLRADSTDAGPAWPAAWQSEHAQDQLWDAIAYHGVVMQLYARRAALSDWPDALLARIADEARVLGLWEETHRRIIAKLVAALAEAGIATVIMKGTALAYSLYDDPATRRRGDSDVLVEQARLDDARNVLLGLGFRRKESPQGLYFQEMWLHSTGTDLEHCVDLHWQPTDSATLQNILKASEFLNDTRPLPRLHAHALMPAPVLCLVHIVLNQAWHTQHGLFVEGERVRGQRRLTWLGDYDHLARSFSDADWRELAEFCQARNIGRIVEHALQSAVQELGSPVPQSVLDSLDRAPIDPEIEHYLARSDRFETFAADWRAARGLSHKYRLLHANLIPSRAQLLLKYPDEQRWPTALLQVRRMFDIAVRALNRSKDAQS